MRMPVHFETGTEYVNTISLNRRSQWARGLSRSSTAARLLRLWVRIPPGAWIFVCCECWLLSGKRSLRRIDHLSRGVLPTVVRCCVWSRNPENEEAKARYRAVKVQSHMGCNARETNISLNLMSQVIKAPILINVKMYDTSYGAQDIVLCRHK